MRTEVADRREVRAGGLVTISSRVLRIGRTSITCGHTMTGSVDTAVHAEAEIATFRFELADRRAVELPPKIRIRGLLPA